MSAAAWDLYEDNAGGLYAVREDDPMQAYELGTYTGVVVAEPDWSTLNWAPTASLDPRPGHDPVVRVAGFEGGRVCWWQPLACGTSATRYVRAMIAAWERSVREAM